MGIIYLITKCLTMRHTPAFVFVHRFAIEKAGVYRTVKNAFRKLNKS